MTSVQSRMAYRSAMEERLCYNAAVRLIRRYGPDEARAVAESQLIYDPDKWCATLHYIEAMTGCTETPRQGTTDSSEGNDAV